MTTPDRLFELARQHHVAGRLAEAESLHRTILERDPGYVKSLVALGTIALQTGRPAQSIASFREVVRVAPDDAGGHLTLGSLLHMQGSLDDAASVYRRAIETFPTHPEAYEALGNVERARGNLDAAIAAFAGAVQLRPGFWEARNNLALSLQEARRPLEAERQLREALRQAPDRAELHHNLGVSLAALGRLEEAEGAYRRATELASGFAEAHNNLGATAKILGRLDQALAAFDTALRIRPDWAAAASNMAGVLEWQARHDDALAWHRRAMSLAPGDAGLHGNYLFTLLFHPRYDARTLLAEHVEWSRRHAERFAQAGGPRHDNDRTPGRRLRIGYVGGLFRDHVVGRNLLPLWRDHDRDAVEVIGYSSNRIDDAMTERFKRLSDEWREIGDKTDEEVAALIRRDRIDVLVDTALHLEGNRLLVLARKPSPVQVTFAGYPGTTGLAAIDYRLTDRHLDPPGSHDAHYAEASWRLPDSFWCYDAAEQDVAEGPLPARSAGHVTFGCLNNFSKVNDPMLSLWAEILAAVPRSRLLLLCHEGSHRRRAVERLGSRGIEAYRVEFAGYRPRVEYLRLFQRIDLSLDTVPYNGHTTSLDSLWMGVPVVTLVGETVVGRAGMSQSTNLGLTELITRTPGDYVATAVRLAGDLDCLISLRRTLRSRMVASPLMDATRFTRSVEAAYREMWHNWCAGASRLSAS